MTTTTVYSNTNDDGVESRDNTYATARAGTGTLVLLGATSATLSLWWRINAGNYQLGQHFFDFDTSAIADTDTVSAAVLSLYEIGGLLAADSWGSVYARLFDFSTTITTADYRAMTGTSAGDTLLASLARASWTGTAYNDLSSQAAFAANVNKTGSTRLYTLISDGETTTAPTGNNRVAVSMADTAGTTQDPKLTVTHSAGTTVTPGVASLTLTAQAPSTVLGTVISPGVLALATSLFTPTVLNPWVGSPGLLALVTALQAPSIAVGITVAPGILALATSLQAPTVLTPVVVAPGIVALTASPQTPTVSIGTIVSPAIVAAALTAFAATVAATAHVWVTPGIVAAALTAFAATVLTPVVTSPDPAALTLSPRSPSIVVAHFVSPGILALVTTPYEPTLREGIAISPGVASLVTALYAPSLLFGTPLGPGSLALVITLYTPDGIVTTTVVTGRYRPQAGTSAFRYPVPGAGVHRGASGDAAAFNRPGTGAGSYYAPKSGGASVFRRPGQGA